MNSVSQQKELFGGGDKNFFGGRGSKKFNLLDSNDCDVCFSYLCVIGITQMEWNT